MANMPIDDEQVRRALNTCTILKGNYTVDRERVEELERVLIDLRKGYGPTQDDMLRRLME